MLLKYIKNTESVSLFLKIECRKFLVEGIGRHFAASHPLWIVAWTVAYLSTRVSYNPIF